MMEYMFRFMKFMYKIIRSNVCVLDLKCILDIDMLCVVKVLVKSVVNKSGCC